MSAVTVGALVRPVGDDLRNAFFRVAEITRNGWARCYCVAYSDGTRTTPEGRSRPKFRTRELAVVEALPVGPLSSKMKIAINKCYGGFGLSQAVYAELGIKWDNYGYLGNKDMGIESDNYMAYRQDPRLIAAIEKIGEDKASGELAKVRVVDIPDGVEWEIDEYDGIETIHEKHRSW